MKKAFFILALSLIGVSCNKPFGILDSNKLQSTLSLTAQALGWTGDPAVREPSEEKYLKSYAIYGQARQSLENTLDSELSGLEIREYESAAGATEEYAAEDCFKGNGIPIKISGLDACCLNNTKNGSNVAIMRKDNFILKATDYFHYNCEGKEFLKKFWEIYNSKL